MTVLDKLNKILKTAWDMGIDIKGITLDESFKEEMNKMCKLDKSGFGYGKRNGFGTLEISYSKK